MSNVKDIRKWGFTDFIQYFMLNPYPDFDYTKYINKHKVKSFVKPVIKIAKEYAYFNDVNQVDKFNFKTLPSSFIIKAVHASGWYIRVIDDYTKEYSILNFDEKYARYKMKKWLTNKYKIETERQYGFVNPGVLIEEYLGLNCYSDGLRLNSYPIKKLNEELREYKLWYIRGRLIGICCLDYDDHKVQNFYDSEWNELPFTRKNNIEYKRQFEKPDTLQDLVKTGKRLVDLIHNPPFVRVDIYDVCGELYFGEYTFTPSGATNKFVPEEYESKFGEMFKSLNE